MKRAMWALAAALAIPAGAAHADVPTHCAPSDPAGVFACASFAVSFDATTGVITVKIQNTDIWATDNGVNPVGHGYTLTGFGIQAPAITGASLAGVGTEGAVSTYGDDPADEWDFTTSFAGFTVEAGADPGGVNGGINGCNSMFGNQGFNTCSGGVNTGHVVFTFNTTMTDWDASAAQIAFRAQGGEWSYRCADVDGTNGGPCPPTHTTPEPMSMLLLATGLVGVGGVGLRRRRKNGIDA